MAETRARELADLANNATGLETLTVSDITDLTVGISNGNYLTANANVADDDFLRGDGTAVEGRTAAETLSDIGAAALAGASFTGDVTMATNKKVKQKGAFLQSSTHQALTLGY